jgi:hypothetical protein
VNARTARRAGLLAAAAVAAGVTIAAARREAGGGLDAVRRDHVAEIARALKCQVEDGVRLAPTMEVLQISPACLRPQRGLALRDPRTGAPYRISFPDPDHARVCATLDRPRQSRGTPLGEVDGTGCVTVFLAPD